MPNSDSQSLSRLEDALPGLLDSCAARGGAETVPLGRAAGRILFEDHHAGADVPPWANSAMDGYAVAAACCRQVPVRLPVSQRIPAGAAAAPLDEASAARIFTGAPLPEGADAVVMQENCRETGGEVEILKPVFAGDNVREAGNDLRQGQRILTAGRRLRPADLGLLASTGVSRIAVRERLRVALLATGDELIEPGRPLGPGQIYDSNHYTVAAMIEALGCEYIDLGIVGDDPRQTLDALREAASRADCVVTLGGVSVGEEDHVRDAVERLGQLRLWKLAIKPGKPFAFGHLGQRPFFGLPGNPVSAFVTFALVVRPCLLRLAGAGDCLPRSQWLSAGFEAPRSGAREEYLRVTIDETRPHAQLRPFSNQSSGVLSSLSHGDGLAVIPPHTAVQRGDLLRFLAFDAIV